MKEHGNFRSLVGERFGKLLVTAFSHFNKHGHSQWVCKCDCGTEIIAHKGALKTGRTISCKCARKGVALSNGLCIPGAYGKRRREYDSWANMLRRCNSPRDRQYKDYGGRGITVCERWYDAGLFFEDMGPKPTLKHTLERRDVNGNYEPSNCYWALQIMQQNNKRNNLKIIFKGKTQTAIQWERELGLPNKLLSKRITLRGWDHERAMTQPVRKVGRAA